VPQSNSQCNSSASDIDDKSVNEIHDLSITSDDSDCVTLLESPGTVINNNTLWKPYPCGTHYYTRDEILTCFNERSKSNLSNNIAVIGDSMGRFLTQTMLEQVNMTLDLFVRELKQFRGNMSQIKGSLIISYIPLKRIILSSALQVYASKPVITMFTVGRWYLHESTWFMNGTSLSQRLEHLRQYLREWGKDTTTYLKNTPESKVIWIIQDPWSADKCTLRLCHNDRTVGREMNRRNDILNEVALIELKKFPDVWIWKSGRGTWWSNMSDLGKMLSG
jgi:hypothetical protein